jgi:endosialidase-like protein
MNKLRTNVVIGMRLGSIVVCAILIAASSLAQTPGVTTGSTGGATQKPVNRGKLRLFDFRGETRTLQGSLSLTPELRRYSAARWPVFSFMSNVDSPGVVKTLNGLTGDVTLQAGAHITITRSGAGTLTIAAPNVLTGVSQPESFNLFVGEGAGASNTTGSGNSFFGINAGHSNTDACCNAFFGDRAGASNTGAGNSFFGSLAGVNNTTPNQNSFFGTAAGILNTTGASNSFFGYSAGQSNTTGANNTVIGANANLGSGNLSFATAIGAGAIVDSSNTIVLGTTAETTQISGSAIIAAGQAVGFAPALEVTPSQIGGSVIASNLYIRQFNELPSAAPLCFRASNAGVPAHVIVTCSSSLRYKSDLQSFSGGLDIIQRLKPTAFTWKTTHERDVGLVAEDVAQVEPLFTFRNDKGEIEGVKYANLSVVFINAFKQQQAQIEQQRERINQQQLELEALEKKLQQFDELKKIVCTVSTTAAICKRN